MSTVKWFAVVAGVLVFSALAYLIVVSPFSPFVEPGRGGTPSAGEPAQNLAQIDFHIDEFGPDHIAGWAWSPRDPERRLPIEILVDGRVAGSVVADKFREDLRDAGKSDGSSAFRTAIPRQARDGRPHELALRVEGESEPFYVSKSPVTLRPRMSFVSTFATLGARAYALGIEDSSPTGPFQLLNDRELLLITRCGEVITARLDGYAIETQSLGKLDAPGEFAVCEGRMGVKDLLLLDDALLVSYVAYDQSNSSYRLVLAKFPVDEGKPDLGAGEVIFESAPPVPKSAAQWHQTYGAMAKKNDDELFLSVADFGVPKYIDDDASSLGKIYLINHKTNSAELIAKGIRSPGGLHYDSASDKLWMTEHGPYGGDEVNLVKSGRNYGWPTVSYGTMYGRNQQPDYYGKDWGGHEGFEKPKQVFLPSIGVSQIHVYPETGAIEDWRGDLILGSLKNQTLYRLKVEGEDIAYSEPIAHLKQKIRDIHINANGVIFIKTDEGNLLVLCAIRDFSGAAYGCCCNSLDDPAAPQPAGGPDTTNKPGVVGGAG